jgi:addiction module HigA family antidote
MRIAAHPGRILKREFAARGLSASAFAAAVGVPAGRITEILGCRRSVTADTAIRLGLYFGNSPRFWLDLQTQHDLSAMEAARGKVIAAQVRARRTRRLAA